MNKLVLEGERKQILRNQLIKHLMLYLYWQRNLSKKLSMIIPLNLLYSTPNNA